MLVPLSWLKELVDAPSSTDELCELLTNAGIETEVAVDARPDWSGVVTAVLRSVDKHPGADALTVTVPFDGSEERTVVCGATNHKAGDVIALATHGTKLPNGLKIKRSKIRGVRSEGMLCSEAELGLSEEAAGILILPPGTPIGVPLSEVLSAGDVILDVAPTANRGDCLSVLGLAREVAAVTGGRLKGRGADPTEGSEDDEIGGLQTIVEGMVAPGTKIGGTGTGERRVEVRIESVDGCPRYAAAVMTGVTIRQSPAWMRRRLEAMGMRAINNVVDCTNYVMLELGNPLHAFDRRRIAGDVIVIRRAAEGETCTTLDDKDRVLDAGDLVIADGEGIIALAGVMGAANSEVADDTTTLVLEAAHFDPRTVRRTAHRTRITSDAAYRFARGVDPELPRAALSRLIGLLEATAGARLDGAPVDLYPAPITRSRVDLRYHRVRGLLGLDLSRERVTELLERGDLAPRPRGDDVITAQPPSYRFDIEREVDILEEVARLEGFDKIPETLPSAPLRSVPRRPAGLDVGAVRDAMVRLGLSEAIHWSFVDPGWIEKLGLRSAHPHRARAVPVGNPLSEVGGILRPTLLPSLLATTARNLAMGAADIRLFEVRNTFLMREGGFGPILDGGDGRPSDESPALESRSLCGVLVGRRAPPGWDSDDASVDLFDVKACVEAAERVVGWRGFSWTSTGPDLPPFLDPREAMTLTARRDGRVVGWMGRLAVSVLRAFDLGVKAYAFELDLGVLAPRKTAPSQFSSFSKFPGVERDLALVAPDSVSAGDLLATASKVAKKQLKGSFRGARVFDVYRGEAIPAGSRSVAIRLVFRALDRTLEDKAVDKAMAAVVRRLTEAHPVTVRA
jgi:phenylalanyl-tRNA synthetase beta chain